ncbi:MAG: cytochrome c family protein, partial [Sphingomonadaceae bacterium]|nr:cytochrome c family protein [Sphingomonadaceae bacterium]
MMSQFNTIAGWVLAGGIVALGASIVTGEVFHGERPETMGYHVEGVVEEGEGGEAETPIAVALAAATPEQGEEVFRRCMSCHTINQGGADGLGPNLHGILGAPHGHRPGFAYSEGLAALPGNWSFDEMNEWLRRPAAFIPGTKMNFAGLSSVEERAAVILYLNAQGSNLPLPAAPVAEAPAEGEAAGNETAAGN